MADSTIGSLPSASEILNEDLFVLEQNGEAKKLLGSTLNTFLDRNILDVTVSALSPTETPTVSYNTGTGALALGIPRGCGIANIALTSSAGLVDTYTVTLDQLPSQAEPTTFTFNVNNAKSITGFQALSAAHTPGTLDQYSINFNDGTSTTLLVYNGANGTDGTDGTNGVSIYEIARVQGTGAAGTSDKYNVILTNGTVAGSFYVYNGNDGEGSPGTFTPQMDGTAAVGTASAFAREDHVHPTDTSRQSANIYLENVTANGFVAEETPTYTDYGYRCAIANANVTIDMVAEVVFSPEDALSGNYAPVCQTYNGGIYIYSKVNDIIEIPTIIIFTSGSTYSPTPIQGDVATRTDINNDLYS